MTKKIKKIEQFHLVYLMLLPGILVTGIFSYAPMYGLYMAFSDYKLGRSILGARFVGLANFKEFILDSIDFLSLLRNTIAMNILSLFIGLLVAMIMAIILNETHVLRIKKIVQTSTFFPFFISWVIVYNIFSVFLGSQSGVLNTFMKDIGLIKKSINYLTDPRYSWGLIVGANLWKMLGYNSVLFLASISGIEVDLYEAADIDGADRLQKIWFITIPAILPTLQVLLVLNFGHIFSSNFDQFYLFTNGLNRPTMEVFDMYVYRFGLKQLNYSYATAVGFGKSFAGLIMIIIMNRVSKKVSGRSVF